MIRSLILLCEPRLFHFRNGLPRALSSIGTNGPLADLCNAVWIKDRNMFERLLEPGCTESPACQCGSEMHIATIEIFPEGSDAAVRVYQCDECHREMRLTVWAELPLHTQGQVFSEV
jgi:hypothetical protein